MQALCPRETARGVLGVLGVREVDHHRFHEVCIFSLGAMIHLRTRLVSETLLLT
jgi:hypothetical protein